jgi:hypothetical protein
MRRTCSLILLVALLFTSCGSTWQAVVEGPAGPVTVNGRLLAELAPFAEEVDGQNLVSLEWLLLRAGYEVVEGVTVIEPDGVRHQYEWSKVADDAWWLPDGRLQIGDETYAVAQVEAEPSARLDQVTVRLTDIAPTIAAALGLPAPAQATGTALPIPRAGHVLLLFLDGFGYLRYEEALSLGMTFYPPVTVVASAVLLTGAPPPVNGVEQRGTRTTEAETFFDVATAAGLRVAAVEGDALAFNLRSTEPQLSGDRDGDGHTDDNVLANALAVVQAGMPDLLWVHFHGIDDDGHTYGPNTPEESARVAAVDAAVGELLDALPSDTLVIILADHGMHTVDEEGRLGNHGHLIARDMFIPVWVVAP